MPKYHLLALTNAVPDQAAEFNHWYDEQHLPDVLKVPGVVSAQRYCAAAGLQGAMPWSFLTLYELDTDNPAAVLEELGQRIGSPLMPMTPAMDMNTASAMVLESIGAPHYRAAP